MTDKKSELVTVRLSERDVDRLLRAAEVKWPGLAKTRSNVVGSLALGMANLILEGVEKPLPEGDRGSEESDQ